MSVSILTQKITIMLVDDHALMREGVRRIISLHPDLEVVGEVGNGEEAVKAIPVIRPDVVLLDINIPGTNGIQVVTQMKHARIPAAFLVLTVHDDPEQIIHAMRAGAAGFCSKDIDPSLLVEFIRHVMSGKYVIGEKIFDEKSIQLWLEDRVSEITNPHLLEIGDPHTPLSKREMQILEMVTLGYSNQEIAAGLDISHQTVKNHMTAILRKLNVQDRTQAAVYAIKRGWVRVDNSNHHSQ